MEVKWLVSSVIVVVVIVVAIIIVVVVRSGQYPGNLCGKVIRCSYLLYNNVGQVFEDFSESEAVLYKPLWIHLAF